MTHPTPDHPTANTVRNILANELGLSRETVRELIAEAVQKRLAQLPVEAIIASAAERTLDQMVKAKRHDYTSIRSIVARAAEEHIAARLQVSIKP
jgi:DNA-binding transcriptional regulator LsrR (DeoR family)